ncbi:MAG: tRNA (adenosine(37)-N6)-threonylcarbamoyltransferase complex dimerization subunit type 1 TsaB [Pirellulaceae bacterium]|nr:tRNA (adenosine(37)-N6)-threonylcarbamoyltransferase complex dimerization subunit type 1 TsaB [Pirellulaceae bacterium]
MRILAIETSSAEGSVALLEDSRLVGQVLLSAQPRIAQTLVPAIGQQLAQAGWPLAELDLVAVTQGPGSFTGLRAGVTVAKSLAYAARLEVLGVDTLEVLAWQTLHGDQPQLAESASAPVHGVLDAQRGDLFHATFRREPDDQLARLSPTAVIAAERWLAHLQAGDLVTGSGLRAVLESLPERVLVADPSVWLPRAAAVGRLARRDFLAGRRDDLWRLTPNYFRPSAAEEKADLNARR